MAKSTPADFYVKFTGSFGQRDVAEPSRGQQVEYTVFGTVTGYEEKDRGDGETRVTYSVDVEAVWPKGSARPDNTNQGTLVDHTGKVSADAAGADPEGESGELIDTQSGDDTDAPENVVAFSDSGKSK